MAGFFNSEAWIEQKDRPTIHVKYDDILGRQKYLSVPLPSDLEVNNVKVGGTASSQTELMTGWIEDRCGEFHYNVRVGNDTIKCLNPLRETFLRGQLAVVFNKMSLEVDSRGEFTPAVTSHSDLEFNLHSINIILLNKNEEVARIAVDPFDTTIDLHDLER